MTARNDVAAGNGMRPSELPPFRPHVHPETQTGRKHHSWSDCALTWCTWAGMNETGRIAACEAPATRTD